ncbi:MAG: hypothetical protein AAFY19_05480 [Pseudomonadota bacterium]
MRIFVDLIENLADSVRLIAGLIALIIMGTVFVFTFGATYVASEATEELAITAEELGKDAIRAHAEAERNRELAKDGWGYDAGDSATGGAFGEETGPRSPRRSRKDKADDWGTVD